MAELSPGSTKPRYEPEAGWRKHRERIHKESKHMDHHKDLPFTFSKPKKNKRCVPVECKNCGHVIFTSKDCVGMVCSKCRTYSSVEVLE